jgi:4-amino-4-deoxy-L-arabinose transferase-like glycosyltransferase
MISPRIALALIAIVLILRALMAALLPLSADEAYYWLWSLHPAWGYLDHPPMIAWLIAPGTALFGATSLGVRFAGLVLSIPATWLVWNTATLVFRDDRRAALAALFFNLTLMASVELLAATPDMPSVVTAAAMLWTLAKLQASGNGRWWLAYGVAAGLGLLSKYSALFLGLGTLIWLVADPRGRTWLRTPWPYLAALVALAIFAPHLVWQSQHQWQTFAFQFSRVAGGHPTLRFVGEFLAAQLGLATPVIFVLMLLGLWAASRRASDGFFLAVPVWVGLAYFLEHALHDRVQGNWPAFLYPALAVLAADAAARWKKTALAAIPVAAALLFAVYAQAQFQILPLKKDPLARVLGRDFAPAGQVTAALVKAHLADAVLTTDYETTAWLRFNQPGVPVVQVNEPRRYGDAPSAPATLLKGHLVYLAELRRDQHPLVQQQFGYMGFPTQMQTPSGLYMLYPVSRPGSSVIGKMP